MKLLGYGCFGGWHLIEGDRRFKTDMKHEHALFHLPLVVDFLAMEFFEEDVLVVALLLLVLPPLASSLLLLSSSSNDLYFFM